MFPLCSTACSAAERRVGHRWGHKHAARPAAGQSCARILRGCQCCRPTTGVDLNVGQPIRTLEELSRKAGGSVECTCQKCGRVARFSVYELAQWFRGMRWDDRWPEFARRLRCSPPDGCGERGPAVRWIEFPERPAKPQPPAPRYECPNGVDPEAWAGARDDSERKRLIRAARG